MASKSEIDTTKLPQHVAIIMDGNGRWAQDHGMPRIFGHHNGVKAVRECTEAAAEIGIKYLTLYAFSTENWNRPAIEVNALMSLLVETIGVEVKTLNDNNIQLKAIGDLPSLPQASYDALMKGIADTAHNTGMQLILALNYSSRWELTEATKRISLNVAQGFISPDDITEESIRAELTTKDYPDPDLMIRTSGEQRLSNFLLWQCAYTELYFSPVYWPDIRKEDFWTAIASFQHRERRFGKTSEQLITEHKANN
ncbi:MAG: isoprenyl transferase [Saprospiraceae bacterium]|nr:isoprenyl transferase [Saprospiraceae bacterium]MBP7803143.1 isoprenyl transferase [Saprospiraceae bacterium]MBP8095724.1 isoprenyl transferase [Saprospiraceae bacterium]